MGIAKMNKVYLIAHQSEKERILGLLQQLGVLEVGDLQAKDAENEAWAGLVESDQALEALQETEKRLAEVRFSLDFLQRYYPEKKSMLAALAGEKTVVDADDLAHKAAVWAETGTGVYQALRNTDEKLLALRNEETRLQNLKAQLAPWERLMVPLEEIKSTAGVRIEPGVLPVNDVNDAAAVREEITAAAPAFFMDEVSSVRGESYVLAVYHAADADVVQAALKRHNFSRLAFGQLTGTAAYNLREIESRLLELGRERQAALAGAGEQVVRRQELSFYLDYLTVDKEQKQVVANFARTGKSFIIEGWSRAEDLPKLKKELPRVSETAEIISREVLPGEMYPVALENKKVFAPFEFITKLYDHPNPYGIDPTPALAPFFVVFFGLCMTDAGYGVVLTLLGALGAWKIKSRAARNLMWIIFAGGLSTIFFGWLVGGWFGLQVLGAPYFFDAMANPILMLIYALILGAVQILAGMLIKAWRLIKDGKVLDAVFDVGFWIVMFAGFAMFGLPQTADIAGKVVAGAAAGLVLTQGRSQRGVLKKFTSGLLSLYSISGYFSDLLSYSRLMALGLATGVIAMVINTMAGLLTFHPVGYVFMVVLLLVGHTFNVLVNVLGSYIHSSRLQYIEFYNRFYQGGGRAFVPFRLSTKHIDIRPQWLQK